MRVPALLLLGVLLAVAVNCGGEEPRGVEERTSSSESEPSIEVSMAEAREDAAFLKACEEASGSRSAHHFSPGVVLSCGWEVARVDEELNIVLLTIGTNADLAVNDILTVHRAGEAIGNLIIDKKGDDWAAGHMDLTEMKTFPRRGDSGGTGR